MSDVRCSARIAHLCFNIRKMALLSSSGIQAGENCDLQFQFHCNWTPKAPLHLQFACLAMATVRCGRNVARRGRVVQVPEAANNAGSARALLHMFSSDARDWHYLHLIRAICCHHWVGSFSRWCRLGEMVKNINGRNQSRVRNGALSET